LAFRLQDCWLQAEISRSAGTVTNELAQCELAIKAHVVTNFLDAKSVACTSGSLGSTALQQSEIAERAKFDDRMQ
jgi:hypothetical protein